MTAFAPRFTITNAITAGLTAIERARGFLEAATLSDEWVRRMSQRALLLEAHHTTHIEGTQLTIEQAERLWAGQDGREARAGRRARAAELSRGVQSGLGVSGQRRADHRGADPRDPQAAGGRRARRQGGPGAYRTIQNYVGEQPDARNHLHAAAARRRAAADAGAGDGCARRRPSIRCSWPASRSFSWCTSIPFVDGNGRTSRLLSTLCLYRAGYDFKRLFTLSEYYDRDRSASTGRFRVCASRAWI